MTEFIFCKSCKGRGEVHPNSRYATNPANMTGELRDYSTSICRSCTGTGMKRETSTMLYCRADCACADCRRVATA